ncbi:SRPBCC family protein [Antrihabitans sp. YC2-6]|uniref:SRPBCC family protein n=1 Tax=Antrihabitans sp. YC2-6 TaxID=2799498 RepID=UPI0018F33FC8|nr:SRPBCC family protein [Antrihabitans sp. YC2-6]MBJ8343507.1 SRPBCC family protein [Antrihabitans sp. YC2-6]
MSHPEIRLSKAIDAPPSAVWHVLTDLDNADATLRGVRKVERLDGSGYEVGTRWRETRTIMGKTATEEMWVAEIEPERRTVIRASSDGADYMTEFLLEPKGAGTELAVAFSADAARVGAVAKMLMTVVGGIARKATEKALRQDLDDIATAAQALSS